MQVLEGLLPDTWLAWITAVVTVCAAVTVVLPPPGENGNIVYRVIYRAIQWVALNLGKAKNAQDVQPPKTIPAHGKR